MLFAGRTRAHETADGVDVAVAGGDHKRIRRGDVFTLVAKHGLRTVLDIYGLAAKQASQGDNRLAEFCTSCGEEQLGELVRSALSVLQAPGQIMLLTKTRLDLLQDAASQKPCVCKGVWIPAALRLLTHHGENIPQFCQDVRSALELGACRGANMAIIGEPGCGKSMVFEAFDEIFQVMGKPEAKSTFPLAGVLDAQILVWHEYKHKDSIVLFEDLLALTVGERMGVRVPHKKNVPHRNTAPLFYTSNSVLKVVREDVVEMTRLNAAMAERFRTRYWVRPIPPACRIKNVPRCGRCCALFYMDQLLSNA